MSRHLIAAIALIALCACMPTRQEVKQEWEGRHISEAIAELGPPQDKMEVHGGVTVYIWEQEYGSATSPSRAACRKGLHADQDGLIVDASQISESLLCE